MIQLRARRAIGIAGVAIACVVLGAAGLATTRTQAVKARPSWKAHLASVDAALAAKNVSAAVMAWRDAYGAALATREWEAMLAVGQTSLRIDQVAGDRAEFEPKARQSYLAALFRARQQGSLDGVLHATEAFATLGDRDVVEQGLRIARQVAGRDHVAQARVRGFAERFVNGVLAADTSPNEPF